MLIVFIFMLVVFFRGYWKLFETKIDMMFFRITERERGGGVMIENKNMIEIIEGKYLSVS